MSHSKGSLANVLGVSEVVILNNAQNVDYY